MGKNINATVGRLCEGEGIQEPGPEGGPRHSPGHRRPPEQDQHYRPIQDRYIHTL